jgi:hypothetical protein
LSARVVPALAKIAVTQTHSICAASQNTAMDRAFSLLALGMALLVAAQPTRGATNFTWAGQNNAPWSSPQNWVPVGVPGADDNVLIGPWGIVGVSFARVASLTMQVCAASLPPSASHRSSIAQHDSALVALDGPRKANLTCLRELLVVNNVQFRG